MIYCCEKKNLVIHLNVVKCPAESYITTMRNTSKRANIHLTQTAFTPLS